MNLIFRVKDELEDYKCIASLFNSSEHERVQKYICKELNLNINNMLEMNEQEKLEYIFTELHEEYKSNLFIMQKKETNIQNLWNSVSTDISSILGDIFKVDMKKFGNVIAELSLNVVCPRYLDNLSFDINYRKDDQDIILTCIHEIIHFIWFDKWKSLFNNYDDIEFNAPHLPWLFSEIAIDVIIKNTNLNRYCHIEKPAYNYLYDIKFQDRNMMTYFRELYNNDIEEFMVKGFDIIKNNESFFYNIVK